MNLLRDIGKLAARTFTDPRLFGVPAKYIRKGGGEIDIVVTPYQNDEHAFRFMDISTDMATSDFLVRTESLAIDGIRFEPSTDDRIVIGNAIYKLNKSGAKPASWTSRWIITTWTSGIPAM